MGTLLLLPVTLEAQLSQSSWEGSGELVKKVLANPHIHTHVITHVLFHLETQNPL